MKFDESSKGNDVLVGFSNHVALFIKVSDLCALLLISSRASDKMRYISYAGFYFILFYWVYHQHGHTNKWIASSCHYFLQVTYLSHTKIAFSLNKEADRQ